MPAYLQPVALEAMTDAQLAAEVERELAALSPRARVFALAMGSGSTAVAAATEAKLSVQPVALMRQKRRTAAVQRLLREQARRRSLLTLEGAVARFRLLSAEARARGDIAAATRALREAALLLGLYPETRLRLAGDPSAPLALLVAQAGDGLIEKLRQMEAHVVPDSNGAATAQHLLPAAEHSADNAAASQAEESESSR